MVEKNRVRLTNKTDREVGLFGIRVMPGRTIELSETHWLGWRQRGHNAYLGDQWFDVEFHRPHAPAAALPQADQSDPFAHVPEDPEPEPLPPAEQVDPFEGHQEPEPEPEPEPLPPAEQSDPFEGHVEPRPLLDVLRALHKGPRGDDDVFNREMKPRVDYVSGLVGRVVHRSEIDAIWNELEQDSAEE